jgi:hypothetical protein
MDDRAKALPLSVPDPVAVATAQLEEAPPATAEQLRSRHRSRRPREVRARTISIRRMTKRELALGRLLNPPVEDLERPRTRAECAGGERPCPFVSCKHHLYLDVSAKTGAIKLNFPDLEVWEMNESCALDVADRGGVTLEEAGAHLNVTRERVRQLEVTGLAKVAEAIGVGSPIRDYVEPGPVGKRRLPLLAAESESEEEDLEEEPPPSSGTFDVETFVSLDDAP